MFYLSMHLPVPYEQLYMRRDNDFRPDHIVKQEILDMIRRDGYNVVKAYDDRPEIAKVWEAGGIPTILVKGFGFDD
jgi:hypothetical protein